MTSDKKNQSSDNDNSNTERGKEMENQTALNMKKIAEEVLRFYESSIDEVSTMVNSTNQILGEFRNERNTTNNTLKYSLAKEKSLRKKDFDSILNEIIPFHDKKEENIKATLNDFLSEQKKTAEMIKQRISSNEKIRLEEFREMINEIQTNREDRVNEVKDMLQDFQLEYRQMGENLQNLLETNKSVRLRDVRNMMNSFEKDRQERKTETLNRAKEWRETAKELAELRKERLLRKN